MSNPTLDTVLQKLSCFGMDANQVKKLLGSGKTAESAFEAIKQELTRRWSIICQEKSFETQKELRPVYDELMALKMSKRTTAKDYKKAARKFKRAGEGRGPSRGTGFGGDSFADFFDGIWGSGGIEGMFGRRKKK
tara:strand:+ start:837 stop:1241 length:405 start_codon:yes stop_codon:yes gene_type:complete